MYPLGNYMNKRNVFFAFLWLFLCLHAMYLEKSPVDFLREVFAVCPVPITRSETWTKTVDVFIRSVTKRHAFYTAICGITGSEIECRFQWCKRRGRLQTSRVFHKPIKDRNKGAFFQIEFIQDGIDRVEFLWLDCRVLAQDSWVFSSPGSSLLNLVIVYLTI